ncbi:MAG: hypothetical protein P4L84_19590 [Isosphaeraceae bacterium]|nr:hypothetical protein [Isosphaeraceae bacterium]
MPLPRFHIQTLMIAFGSLAGLQRMDQRGRRLLALARQRQQREVVNRLISVGLAAQGAGEADVERHRMLAEYHRALGLKYDRAGRRPWLPVAPDLPEPK